MQELIENIRELAAIYERIDEIAAEASQIIEIDPNPVEEFPTIDGINYL